MPDDPSDAELVEAARRDPAGFDALYRRHLGGVYRYVLARVGSVHLAEDISANVFLDALTGLGGYREQGHFAAWLYRIAHRHVGAAWRQRRDEPLAAEMESVAPGVSEEAERLLLLSRAMRELTNERREALFLRFFAGLRVAEIAAAMDKGESAVKMLIHRGLAQLRDNLAEDDVRRA